jgi:hypothetical protein
MAVAMRLVHVWLQCDSRGRQLFECADVLCLPPVGRPRVMSMCTRGPLAILQQWVLSH